MVTNEEALKQIKNIRVQVREEGGLSHTKVEFVNGSMICSCGMSRGEAPDLQPHCTYGLDVAHKQLYWGKNHPLMRRALKDLLFMCHYSVNGCGFEYGDNPDPICVCGVELSQHHQSDPMHNFVDAEHYNSHG